MLYIFDGEQNNTQILHDRICEDDGYEKRIFVEHFCRLNAVRAVFYKHVRASTLSQPGRRTIAISSALPRGISFRREKWSKGSRV